MPVSFLLPLKIQVLLIAILSWFALIVSAATFIAAMKAKMEATEVKEEVA